MEKASQIARWLQREGHTALPFQIASQFSLTISQAESIHSLLPRAFGSSGKGEAWLKSKVEKILEESPEKMAEAMLVSLNWVKTPGMGMIFAPIGRAKLGRLLNAFGVSRAPRPGHEILIHEQNGVKFVVSNKADKFEIDVYGDVGHVIPQISKKAKVRVPTTKSQWAY